MLAQIPPNNSSNCAGDSFPCASCANLHLSVSLSGKYEKVRGRSRTIKMVGEGRRRKVVGVLKGTEKLQHRWEAHKSTEERDERVAQKEGGSDQQGGASPGGKAQPSPGEESPTPHLTDTHLLPASFSLTIHPSIY
ncbi:hypothetical protein niasHT_015954 [Heterodera trifolii]|uniref:Uncharacterized protein n=1 Tax=Heterodera trifolii TaxID=157864 RepID=A0ABD2LB90_9BILA